MAKLSLDIKSLMKPAAEKVQQDKKISGIPADAVWRPFFLATNATGESHISPMALGGMQLRRDKTTGSPKLKETKDLETGVVTLSPVYVHPQALITAVRGVMDNFAFGLMAFSAAVQKSHPNEYKAQVDAAGLAGAKTRAHDEKSLGQYLAQLEAAKGILAAPPIETADDIASKEDAKEPVPA